MINGKTVYPKLPRRSERLKKLQEAQEARDIGQLIRHCKAVQWLPLSHYGLESKVVDVDTIMGVESVSGMDSDLFQPAPKTWKQILTLPTHLKKHWVKSWKAELGTIIKMGTFVPADDVVDEPLIPVTMKMRIKLKSDGTIDKLKARCCLRGDYQQDLSMTGTLGVLLLDFLNSRSSLHTMYK